MTKKQMIEKELRYLARFYMICIQDISPELLDYCCINPHFEFQDNAKILMKIDNEIFSQYKRVKQATKTYHDTAEAVLLASRLRDVHKEFLEVLQNYYEIESCYEKGGKLTYLKAQTTHFN